MVFWDQMDMMNAQNGSITTSSGCLLLLLQPWNACEVQWVTVQRCISNILRWMKRNSKNWMTSRVFETQEWTDTHGGKPAKETWEKKLDSCMEKAGGLDTEVRGLGGVGGSVSSWPTLSALPTCSTFFQMSVQCSCYCVFHFGGSFSWWLSAVL